MSETEAYNGVAKLSSCTKQKNMWLINTIQTPYNSLFLLYTSERWTTMIQQLQLLKNSKNGLKKSKLAASRTRKEEEERRLIAAGEDNLAKLNIQLTYF